MRGVNWLGDAIMTTPALLRLREKFSSAHIALLTRDSLADIWTNHPAINQVITFNRGESLFSLGRELKGHSFDTAILFPNSTRAALEAVWAKIPVRVGYRGGARGWMLTHSIAQRENIYQMRKRTTPEIKSLNAPGKSSRRTEIPPASHHIYHYLDLVSGIGASAEPMRPWLRLSENEVAAVANEFGLPQREESVLVGLNAGAEYGPAKRWPVARFIETAIALSRRIKCQFVIFGGAADFTIANEIVEGLTRNANPDGTAASITFYNLAGKTTLRQLCGALKICDVVISNDTGPAHVAAAVGTPVVIPFGSTSPELTGPGLPGDEKHVFLKSTVPCSPCFVKYCPIDHRCMTEITVDQVANAVCRIANEA